MTTVAPPEVPTVEEHLAKLQTLGTHKEIALFLAGEGITGTCSNAGLCPIARYLQAETGCVDIAVDENEVTAWYYNGAVNSRTKVPPAVADSIAFFDSRMYPELVDPETPDNRALYAKLRKQAFDLA